MLEYHAIKKPNILFASDWQLSSPCIGISIINYLDSNLIIAICSALWFPQLRDSHLSDHDDDGDKGIHVRKDILES